jgi:hypothetical protein
VARAYQTFWPDCADRRPSPRDAVQRCQARRPSYWAVARWAHVAAFLKCEGVNTNDMKDPNGKLVQIELITRCPTKEARVWSTIYAETRAKPTVAEMGLAGAG